MSALINCGEMMVMVGAKIDEFIATFVGWVSFEGFNRHETINHKLNETQPNVATMMVLAPRFWDVGFRSSRSPVFVRNNWGEELNPTYGAASRHSLVPGLQLPGPAQQQTASKHASNLELRNHGFPSRSLGTRATTRNPTREESLKHDYGAHC